MSSRERGVCRIVGCGRSYCGSAGRGTRQKWCRTWKKQRQRCYGGARSPVMEM